MLVNYAIQALLTTLYFVVLASNRMKRIPPRLTDNRRVMKGVEVFQHSTRVFLDSAILFCLSMLVAAMTTFAKAIHAEAPLPIYTSITLAFMSVYSVIPAVILHASLSHTLRRARWRSTVWAIIGCIGVVVIALFRKSLDAMAKYKESDKVDPYSDTLHDPDHQLVWDAMCMNHLVAYNFRIYAWLLHGLLMFIGSVYVLILLRVRLHGHLPDIVHTRLVHRIRAKWWLIASSIAMIRMWICLIIFFHYRAKLNRESGETNQDRDWSFGQILGLATWVPVVVEFVHILVKNPKDALTGQLIAPYYVASTEETVRPEQDEEKNGAESREDQPFDNADSSENAAEACV